MKRLVLFLLVSSLTFGASFVDPGTFGGSSSEKEQVVAWIKHNIKEEYSAIGMDDAMTLRMMEKEDLDCFKKLTKVDDKSLLKRVIRDYRAVGMDTYNTIWMMYQEQKKASGATLNW